MGPVGRVMYCVLAVSWVDIVGLDVVMVEYDVCGGNAAQSDCLGSSEQQEEFEVRHAET